MFHVKQNILMENKYNQIMEYTLIKSKRKSVALEISPEGSLIVRAPLNFTEKDAKKFINKNEKWIFKHLPSILAKKEEITKLSDKDILLAKKKYKNNMYFFDKKIFTFNGRIS